MNDLISRQAAIDAIEREKTYASAFRDGYAKINVFEKYNMGLTDGIKAIKRLPSAQQWIPVSERLPEDTRTVLTTFIESGVVKVDTLNYFGEPLGWTDFRYNEELGRPKSYDVTAWMELPEPWRGEE